MTRKVTKSRVEHTCGRVGNGFYGAYGDVRTAVRDFVNSNKDKTVYVVGHSLGGAIATIAAQDLAKEGLTKKDKLFLFSYGSPAAGDDGFTRGMEEAIPAEHRCRLVVHNDLVPWTLDAPFQHFSPTWTVSVGEGQFDSPKAFARTDVMEVIGNNHAMDKYVQSCDIVIGGPFQCPPRQNACPVVSSCPTKHAWLGDGYCDPDLNNAQYCFDEGDCCAKSCAQKCGKNGENCPYKCGSNGYHCKNIACARTIDSPFN
jgi:acetyl esterase/lipase